MMLIYFQCLSHPFKITSMSIALQAMFQSAFYCQWFNKSYFVHSVAVLLRVYISYLVTHS